MINHEIKSLQSIVYLNDNGKKKFGKGVKHLMPCVVEFLKVAEGFIHSASKVEAKWPKSMGIELSLTLCGKRKIQTLNRDYRGKNKVTDVLSFPQQESLRTQSGAQYFGKRMMLGDIVICRDVTSSQAKNFKITYEQELIHLLIHGFLHLCGFDHEVSQKEEKLMFDLEQELVKKVYKNLGYE